MDKRSGLLLFSLAATIWADFAVSDPPAQAQPGAVAYATRDATGAWSFSDIPNPDARAINLPQSQTPAPTSEELVAQMLQVAASLEAARLDREDRRVKPASTPTTIVTPEPAPAYAPYYYPQRRPHRPPEKPVDPVDPKPRESQKIRFPVDF